MAKELGYQQRQRQALKHLDNDFLHTVFTQYLNTNFVDAA